ncbi:MAG: hypothetical protein WBD90_06745 [Xanthobacteraceae bacterium]
MNALARDLSWFPPSCSVPSPPPCPAGVFLIGLFIGMGGSGAIALAALTYPPAIRSSGVGWAMGVGRFAQVLAPLFVGFATAAGWSSV